MDKQLKIKEAVHPFAYTDKKTNKPLTAEEEYNRIKKQNIIKPIYYSFTTDEELILIDEYTKKKTNKKTGERIKVKPFFKKKDRITKNTDNRDKTEEYTEDNTNVSRHESLLHELAKTCFVENKVFKIKGLQVENKLSQYSNKVEQYYTLLDNDTVVISQVDTEQYIKVIDNNGNILMKKPDIRLRCYHLNTDSYFDLYIEIAVKHKKTDDDIELFKLNNLNVIEIDLSNLIEISSKISDADTDGAISPKKFLNKLNAVVMSDISRQTWISNSLYNKYIVDMESVRIKYVEKCAYRNMGQEGMLTHKCDKDTYGSGSRTIVNLTCTRCKDYVSTIGDYEYIKNLNKTKCEEQVYVVCCNNKDILNKNNLSLNITKGYDKL